jgi:CDP-glucose 4,6-dehydratase
MFIYKNYFKNKKIIITGHTGFKGSWLTFCLHLLGSNILGISKNYPTNPCHFRDLNIKKNIKNEVCDITNLKKLKKIFKQFQPDYVFHLAAQAIVSKSFKDPISTFNSNTIGTLNVLESLRAVKKCKAVIITSDKSYKNLEIKRGYSEDDILGGNDPYSGSKGAAELIINSYLKSFFVNKKNIRIAIARAGNVIGGGDWSSDRIIPDCVKSWYKNKKITIRSPKSTRPWQHVLDAIRGYLILAIKLNDKKIHGEAFNFGPDNKQNKNVLDLVKEIKKNWQGVDWKIKQDIKLKNKESNLLKLNSYKAKKILNWYPVLNFKNSIKFTANWYKQYNIVGKANIKTISRENIISYNKLLKKDI